MNTHNPDQMNNIRPIRKEFFKAAAALAFLLQVISFFSFAQLDTVHWIPPLHSRDNAQVEDHYIYLSTPNITSFVVTIKDGSGNILAAPTISNAAPFAYLAGNGQVSGSPLFVRVDSLNKVLTHKGLILTANAPFYANLRVQSASQADCLTAKGKAALGTTFRIGGFPQVLDGSSRNFTAGVMATDSNTTVTISGYNPGVIFAGVPNVSAPSITVILNPGECYVVSGYTNTPANLSGFIGALVQSDKPIVLNNGNMLGTIANNGSQDIGIDQSVPIEKVGKKYILIEGDGNPDMEMPIVIAHYNNTNIFVNGSAVPIAVINAGQFYLVPNSNYQGTGHKNMHIRTSEPVYMYQALAGSASYANGGLNFIPPYNCYLENTIDLIPSVNMIGSTNYTGGVMVFTQQGAVLKINGAIQTGAVPVISVPWETYKVTGLTGNIKITSTKGVAAGIYGFSGAAGYSGYYSGFSSSPMPTTYSYSSFTDTCFSLPVNFDAHYDLAIDSLLWDFGDPGSGLNDTSTLQNAVHTFSSSGNYNVKLIIFRCENDTVMHTISAFSIPAANFSVSDVCYGDSMHFTNTSIVDSASSNGGYLWSFGDGSTAVNLITPAHFYSAPGTYSVSLIVTSNAGCKDTITKSAVVYPLPNVQYSAADVCFGTSIQFADLSAITGPSAIQSREWDFGDSTPVNNNQTASHTYSAADSYTSQLLVISNFGCRDSITKTVIVHPNPVTNFNNTSVCNNTSTQFTDSSYTALGSINTWIWNFGDAGSADNTQSPSHLYANAGTYSVNLIVNNSFDCADTVTKPVQVYFNPVAGFTYGNVCLGDTIHFTDTSYVDNSDSIASYLWVFGDNGPTSILQNQNHYYSNSGTYSAALVTTTSNGCSSASIIPVKVFDAPNSLFTFSNSCLLDSAMFTNMSVNPIMGTTASWSWDFGDGSALNTTLWNTKHVYALPGNYEITLTAYSSNLGCADTLNDTITVFPSPIADFSFEDVCLNQPVIFNDSSAVSGGSITFWSWDFGDGSPFGVIQDPSHTYDAPGTYMVSLIASSNNGCNSTNTESSVVHPLPAAHFSTSNVCDGSIVQLNDLSNILTPDNIQSWRWNFGDSSPVINNQNTSHLYASYGSFTVQLFIVSNFGCLDSISNIIVVNPNPVINFTAIDTVGCEPLCIDYQNLSSIAAGANTSFLWDFGDLSPAGNSPNPLHCYTNDSVYTPNHFNVALTVTSDSGCVSILSKNNYITVYPKPDAVFTVQPQTASITNPVVSFTNLSVGADYWNWNFSGADTSSLYNPAPHTYADTGIYTITLITSTQFNCLDTAYQTVIIEPDFLFYIPNAFTPDGDGINDSFTGKGIFIKDFEMRIFDRWGNLIFFSNDIRKPWDGKANHGSEIAQRDVYIYSFKVTDFKSVKHIYKGVVTLVR